jgi:hypothetical protein
MQPDMCKPLRGTHPKPVDKKELCKKLAEKYSESKNSDEMKDFADKLIRRFSNVIDSGKADSCKLKLVQVGSQDLGLEDQEKSLQANLQEFDLSSCYSKEKFEEIIIKASFSGSDSDQRVPVSVLCICVGDPIPSRDDILTRDVLNHLFQSVTRKVTIICPNWKCSALLNPIAQRKVSAEIKRNIVHESLFYDRQKVQYNKFVIQYDEFVEKVAEKLTEKSTNFYTQDRKMLEDLIIVLGGGFSSLEKLKELSILLLDFASAQVVVRKEVKILLLKNSVWFSNLFLHFHEMFATNRLDSQAKKDVLWKLKGKKFPESYTGKSSQPESQASETGKDAEGNDAAQVQKSVGEDEQAFHQTGSSEKETYEPAETYEVAELIVQNICQVV